MKTVELLFVEDEPLILLIAKETLVEGGFTVRPAASAQEAMRLLDECAETISGVITDIRLGAGEDGWAVARQARRVRSTIPIVYTTGDSAQGWESEGVPKSMLIQKPYAPAQLLAAISSLLAQADADEALGAPGGLPCCDLADEAKPVAHTNRRDTRTIRRFSGGAVPPL